MSVLVCAGCRCLAERSLLRSGCWLADVHSPRAMAGPWIATETVFSPVVRVSECAQDDGVALAGVFDREDQLNYPLPARLLPPNPLCATSSSSVLARMVVLSFIVVQAAGSLLRRKVITAAGILNGGRPPHSHNEWSSWRVEGHGMISPVVRVCREEWWCAGWMFRSRRCGVCVRRCKQRIEQSTTDDQRMPARVLSQ